MLGKVGAEFFAGDDAAGGSLNLRTTFAGNRPVAGNPLVHRRDGNADGARQRRNRTELIARSLDWVLRNHAPMIRRRLIISK